MSHVMKERQRSKSSLAVLLAALVIVTGCGSDDAGSSANSSDETVAADGLDQLAGLEALLAEKYEGEAIPPEDLPRKPPLFDEKDELPERLVPTEGVRTDLDGGVQAFVYRFDSAEIASAGATALLSEAGSYGPVSGCGKNVYFTTRPNTEASKQWSGWVQGSLSDNDRGCKNGSMFQVIE